MKKINIYDAQANLSKLVDDALDGTEVGIGNNNNPLVQIVPYLPTADKKRKLGILKGQGFVNDDFNDPLPADMLAEFYKP